MDNRLFIFDTTLRDGEQVPGCQLNTVEKIQVAKALEALGVDVIEAGFPISSPGDFNSVIEISKAVTWPTICALTRAVQKDIDVAVDALKFAKHKRIHTGWQFGGNGTSFPLAPGADAVIAVNGAIDHAAQYPLSVNLNKPGYFACYNNVYYWNTMYHPAPGDQISRDHYLDVVIKLGQANAYTFSIFSPATVIFKAQDTTIQEYVQQTGSVIQKPGSTVDQVIKIPLDWVIDGVEVYYGGSSSNKKRISPSIDAGYVSQSALYDGRSLHRRVDEEASKEAGYEILEDTNNSSADFYEREQQSLHE